MSPAPDPARSSLPRAGTTTRPQHIARGLLATVLLAAFVPGLPWGLVRFIGWPLPRRTPSGSQIATTLTSPMTQSLLLDVLACILWVAWAVFTADVIRAAGYAIRTAPRPTMPDAGPLQAAAAVLVSTIILSLLAARAAPLAAAGAAPTSSATYTPTVQPPSAEEAATTGPGDAGSRTVRVQPPHAGIHDSLWRIAERALGDGTRWPEIYHLNRGRLQADGHSLTSPSLIRPGWTLRLPAQHSQEHHEPPTTRTPSSTLPSSSPPKTSPPVTTRPPSTTPPSPSSSTPTPSSRPPIETAPPARTSTHGESAGLDLPGGGFVAAGLAAVVAAALLTVRRRRRMHYRPGSGDRADLTIAPVVRALRVAHEDPAEHAGETEASSAVETEAIVPTIGVPTSEGASAGTALGVKNGRLLAWDLARTRGLGLIGPGAHDAARALLVSQVANRYGSADRGADILMPFADAHLLLGTAPPGIRVTESLDDALAELEAQLLTRLGPPAQPDASEQSELILVATPSEDAEHRLQAILDNGSSLGLAGILLGQWRPGGTARIRADGTIAAISPTLDDLTEARLFTLPTGDATDLLDLLQQARPEPNVPTHPPVRTVDPPLPATPSAARKPPARRTLGPGHATPGPKQPERHESQPTAADPAQPTDDPTDEPDPHPERQPAPTAPVQREHGSTAHPHAWHLSVLGRIQLTHHQPDGLEHADATATLAPKHREVLTYLALHPQGARREALADAIWPNAPTGRPYNSFHATLSQLRRALRAAAHDEELDITSHTEDGRYTLDQAAVDVDLWQLHEALDAARHAESPESTAKFERVIELYQGDLAADISTEWLEAPRENLRRDVLDLITHRALTLREPDPGRALALLEHARTLDSYNEALYRAIARLQGHLGQWDAIPRTRALLITNLAAIDEVPSAETLAFFEAAQRPRPAARVARDA